jgi:hypothetical protein
MLRRSYSHHYETDSGQLIPAPGQNHPALDFCATQVRHSPEDMVTVLVALSGTSTAIYTEAVPPSSVDSPPVLRFDRNLVLAEDHHGHRWRWTVWVDQFGRGIAGPRSSG